MKTATKIVACALSLAVVSLLAASVRADEAKPTLSPGHPELVVYDAPKALEFLKTLGGTWDLIGGPHGHDGDAHSVTYRVTGGDSTVMETIFPGEPMEMISMFHMDGDTLLLTHYCALQNQPVMKFEKTDKPGEIKWSFVGGTNFDPKVDAHVHEGVMQIKDPNTVESTYVGYSDGKPGQKSTSVLKRKGK